jgi:hypothetical protein
LIRAALHTKISSFSPGTWISVNYHYYKGEWKWFLGLEVEGIYVKGLLTSLTL